MMRFIIILSLLFSVKSFSQIDITYYKKAEKKDMYVRTSLFRNLFELRLMKGEGLTYFLPNQVAKVAVGFFHPKMPFEIAAGIGVSKVSSDYPKTKAIDLQIRKYAKSFVIDAFFQKYKGFYTDNYVNGKLLDLSAKEVSYPDLKVLIIGVFGQYIFNNDKFSYQAAFNRNDIQLKSAGSLLVGGSLYYLDLDSDKEITKNISRLIDRQFGVNVGYAYNFVMGKKKNWLANLSVSGGLNFNTEFKIRPTYLIRGSCFYNGDRWSAGVSAISNTITLFKKEDVTGRFDTGRVSIVLIRRFRLKK